MKLHQKLDWSVNPLGEHGTLGTRPSILWSHEAMIKLEIEQNFSLDTSTWLSNSAR